MLRACALLAGAAGALQAEEPATPGSAQAAHVRWDADAVDAGTWVAARWPGIVAEVQERLGLAPSLEGAEVVVVRGIERLRAVARVGAPEWAGGVTVAGSRIVVRVDGPQGERLRLASTLRHEAVHLLWARAAGPAVRRLPLWFEEGLAEEVGGEPSVLAGARLEVAWGTGDVLDFDALVTHWPQEAFQADLAYQQGRRWVALLVAREGWAAVRRLLADLPTRGGSSGRDAAFDGALRAATGNGLSDWHADWRRSMEMHRRGWWLWFFTDLGGLLITAVALVCAFAFVGLRRRRRRAIDALPDDPPIEPES